MRSSRTGRLRNSRGWRRTRRSRSITSAFTICGTKTIIARTNSGGPTSITGPSWSVTGRAFPTAGVRPPALRTFPLAHNRAQGGRQRPAGQAPGLDAAGGPAGQVLPVQETRPPGKVRGAGPVPFHPGPQAPPGGLEKIKCMPERPCPRRRAVCPTAPSSRKWSGNSGRVRVSAAPPHWLTGNKVVKLVGRPAPSSGHGLPHISVARGDTA